MDEWIKMSERSPEDGQKVIYYFDLVGVHIGTYERLKGEDAEFGTHCFYGKSGYLTDDVTHWMPLPETPKD